MADTNANARGRGGADAALLAELFSSRVRAAVLGFLLPRPHLGLSLTDLSRRLDLPISSLQHECYKLERIGILVARRAGNARLYRVEASCPLLPQLTALVGRAIGREARLAGAIDSVNGLEIAFLSGRLPDDGATGDLNDAVPSAESDGLPPRLVLVGEIHLDEIDGLIARVERALDLPAGELDVAFFQPDDWRARIESGNSYVRELLAGRRLDLAGSDGVAGSRTTADAQ